MPFLDKLVEVGEAYNEISAFLASNYLKLNNSKSEVILIGSPSTIASCKTLSSSVLLGDTIIPFVSNVKNLGIIFDESLSFSDHINNCRRAAFHTLKNLYKVRNHFDDRGFQTVVHALVITKLDYCNSLFANLPAKSIQKLQSIQNFAARLIRRRNRSSHVTPLLRDLHWLPVSERIAFKVLLLTYKALTLSKPKYLFDQLALKTHRRDLRNLDSFQLEVPRSRSARMGDRAFAIVAPKLWNALPLEIRSASSVSSFKARLKAHLFSTYYHSEI